MIKDEPLFIAMRDNRVGKFMTPILVENGDSAIRSFAAGTLNTENDLGRFCEDFSLYVLGSYEESTGSITPLPSPQILINGIDARDLALSEYRALSAMKEEDLESSRVLPEVN